MAVPNEVYALLREFDKEYGNHWERLRDCGEECEVGMKGLIHCEECREPIEWDDDIIRTECGSIYHEGCCTVFPIRYGVMVGDDYKGNSDDRPSIACALLSHGEYIDIEEREAE